MKGPVFILFYLVMQHFSCAQFSSDTIIEGIHYIIIDTAWTESAEDPRAIVYFQTDGIETETGKQISIYMLSGNPYEIGELRKGQFYGDWYWFQPDGTMKGYGLETHNWKKAVWADTIVDGVGYFVFNNEWLGPGGEWLNLYVQSFTFKEVGGKVFGVYVNTGKLFCRGEMKNWRFCNEWTTWYPNGAMESHGFFHEDGIGKGNEDWYYYNYSFSDFERQKVGTWKWYYDNGQLKTVGSYNEKGLNTGTWKWYYEDGSQRAYVNYLNDYRLAPSYGFGRLYSAYTHRYFEFYPNGNAKAEFIYHDGYTISERWFYETGVPMIYEDYITDSSIHYCSDGYAFAYSGPSGSFDHMLYTDEHCGYAYPELLLDELENWSTEIEYWPYRKRWFQPNW